MTGVSCDDRMLGQCRVAAIIEPKYDHMLPSQRLALKASQLSQAETGTGCWWLLSTPRWHVRKGKICSHKSFRNKVNLKFTHNWRKIRKNKTVWRCTDKQLNWQADQSDLWRASTLRSWLDWTRWSPAVFQLWNSLDWRRERDPLHCNYILMSITYLVLINNWLNTVILRLTNS